MEEELTKENDNGSIEKEAEDNNEAEPEETGTIKISVVGDSGVGKTCMLMTFVNQKYPEEAVNRHSLFENTSGTIHGGRANSFEVPQTLAIGDSTVELGLTDTIGTYFANGESFCRHEVVVLVFETYPNGATLKGKNLLPLGDEYRRFRETFCVKTDIFLVCFSVTEPETLENVRQNWLTEIRILTPKSPFILVGMKTDLRDDSEILAKLKEKDQEPVSMLQGIKMAKSLGAKEYVECSSINLIGVKRVFETAVIVLEQGKQKPKTAKRRSHNTCNIS